LATYQPAEDVMKVRVGRDHWAVIDDADWNLVGRYSWRVHRLKDGRVTARGQDATGREVGDMHRLILGCGAREKVNHRNWNGLDNRRKNLRLATHSETMRNQRHHRDSLFSFKGVDRLRSGHWRARIMLDRKRFELGTFATAREAALAYDRAAREHFGEFAHLNFP
jgi:hypothetical protein